MSIVALREPRNWESTERARENIKDSTASIKNRMSVFNVKRTVEDIDEDDNTHVKKPYNEKVAVFF